MNCSSSRLSIEFDRLSKSAVSCVALSKLLSSEEGDSFMVHVKAFLCTHHSLDYDWFAGLCFGIFVYKYSFNLVSLQDLYWVTTCFIFVCQLDASWNPWESKCYCCYYCRYSTPRWNLWTVGVTRTMTEGIRTTWRQEDPNEAKTKERRKRLNDKRRSSKLEKRNINPKYKPECT